MKSPIGWVLAMVLAACGSDPPPPVVSVPTQPQMVDVPPAPKAIDEPPPAPKSPETPATLWESALRRWSPQTSCDDVFDYHPNGGLQSFWCHAPEGVTLVSVATAAGVDIFSSGPHSKTAIKLDSTVDFGHYNPEFVKWLVEKVPPSAEGSLAQKATQAAYDKHLKPLAEIFFYTLAKSLKDPECFDREKTAYANLIAKKKLPKDYYERWFWFMNPSFCAKTKANISLGSDHGFSLFSEKGFDAGIDGNVTKTVMGFWLRRAMDGTKDEFAEGLKKVLASYEPELVAQPWRAPDGAAIDVALDAAVRKAIAGCKSSGQNPLVRVTVAISPDGTMKGTGMVPGSASITNRRLRHNPPTGDAQVACVEQAFAGKLTEFDGHELHYERAVPLK